MFCARREAQLGAQNTMDREGNCFEGDFLSLVGTDFFGGRVCCFLKGCENIKRKRGKIGAY